MKYRAEIDGLRALAVVPVILFHAGFELFSGGFVGVDVFFVISGYLITTILIEDIENNRFSLVSFYERRARRILPALFFVMLVCIPFAWMWMLPSQMKDFSHSLIAVSLFASNILFWSESGYFAATSEEKPLLHTWSLAVEEQYYVLFPIFLFIVWRFGKNRVFSIIVVMAVISLLLSEWGWRNEAAANFYLAPTRAWELFAGSIAAFVVQKRGIKKNNALSFLGLAAILFSIFAYEETTPFPSTYALVPVLGVVLLVLYADKETLAGRLLRAKAFVGVGLISYSAYLWHQPLFAFARIKSEESPSFIIMGLLALLSIFLSIVSWKWVEKPFRSKNINGMTRRYVFRFSVVGLLFFITIGTLGKFSEGFAKQRYDVDFLARHDVTFLRSERHNSLGAEGIIPSWFLLGDSHADALQDGFSELLKHHGKAALVGTIAGCPPALNLWRHDIDYKMRCHDNYIGAIDTIDNSEVDSILIASRYALYMNSERFDNGEGGVEQGATDKVVYDHVNFKDILRPIQLRQDSIENEMVDFVRTLSNRNVKIFIITSIPEIGWDVPKRMKKEKEVSISRSFYDYRVSVLSNFYSRVSKLPNVALLRSEDVLCDDDRCDASRNSLPLYYDANHPSIYGARELLLEFEAKLFDVKK